MAPTILDTHIKRWFPKLLIGTTVKFDDSYNIFDDRIDDWVRKIEPKPNMIEYVSVPTNKPSDFWSDFPGFNFGFFLMYPDRNEPTVAAATNLAGRYTGIVWTRTITGICLVRNVTNERI